jgi:protein SCO1/2
MNRVSGFDRDTLDRHPALRVSRAFAAILAVALFAVCSARAQTTPAPQVMQRVGEPLPLATRLVDESGQGVTLQRYFDGAPVVLVFGYYRCPTLCTTLMEGVLTGLAATGLDRAAYRVVGVSIDPRENANDARRKAQHYRRSFGNVHIDLLTGAERETRALARAAGVSYHYDDRYDQYSHPLGFLIAAPDGRIARYFPGIAFDAREARLALVDASESRIGSWSDRIFLRCAHYDPATGRYSVAAMSFVRAGSVLIAAALALWMWRRRTLR